MDIQLSDIDVRILGCLFEKETTEFLPIGRQDCNVRRDDGMS